MQDSLWAPHISREAIEELSQKEPDYYRRGDLQLGCTEDLGPWVPSGDIKRYVPNLDDIEIVMLDNKSDFVELERKFINFQDIGLVLMSRNISRSAKPLLIILTTPDIYYAIDPSDHEHGIKFLAACLINPKLRIWTTNGLHEADCLYHQYQLILHKSSARCCLGLHLQMMKILARLSDTETLPIYPERALRLAKVPGRLETYTKLLWVWLDLQDTSELEFNTDQLPHLSKSQPQLNQTSINMIKKRCALVLTLSQYLRFYARLELDIMNTNMMTSLSKMPSVEAKELMRKRMKKDERMGNVNIAYLSHLDGSYRGVTLHGGDDDDVDYGR